MRQTEGGQGRKAHEYGDNFDHKGRTVEEKEKKNEMSARGGRDV